MGECSSLFLFEKIELWRRWKKIVKSFLRFVGQFVFKGLIVIFSGNVSQSEFQCLKNQTLVPDFYSTAQAYKVIAFVEERPVLMVDPGNIGKCKKGHVKTPELNRCKGDVFNIDHQFFGSSYFIV